METMTAHTSRNEKNLRIPATVRIGVTGHRKLDNAELLSRSVKGVLSKLNTLLSHTSHKFIVVSSLAEGADRLEALEYLDAYNDERVNNLELNSAVEAQYTVLANLAVQSELSKKLLDPPRENLLPQFVRADLLAHRYQSRYMKAGSAVYALAAAAVATVTIQTLFFAHLPELLWFEVAEIALILLLLTASHSGE